MKARAPLLNDGQPRKLVRHADLRALSQIGVSHFRLIEPSLSDDAVVLRGDYAQLKLRDGLNLHATDTFELYDLKTQSVQRPGITFSIFLQGSVAAWIGDRKFTLGRPLNSTEVDATAISRARPDSFTRQSVCGAHIRKVNITVSPEWLENGSLDAVAGRSAVMQFGRTHLAFCRWRPSAHVVSLAEQILHPPQYETLLQNLYLESRSIEIVAEAFRAITQSDDTGHGQQWLRPRDFQKVREVCDFLESHLDQAVTLESVARSAGMSVTTLQRTFRAVHGKTVFEYLRGLKLQKARDALERDGISVSEAAFVAGYASPPNFATAFKRAFGINPKAVRSRL